jgi:acetyltransferase-like isoleucine patch superfamily enzyme
MWVAPTAVVEPGCELGEGCTVWDLAHIREGAQIGSSSTIGRNVFIDAGVVVGSHCKIQNNALLYRPAVLGDGVFIGPAVVLTNDRVPRAVEPDGSKRGQGGWDPAGVWVGPGASLGAGTVVLGGVRIGSWAMTGAGAVVTADVPDYALFLGVPARWAAWVGPTGARLQPEGHGRWRCETGQLYVERGKGLVPSL